MNLISTLLSLVGLARELWGLYWDIRKTEPTFRLGYWASRYQDAIQALRESKTKDLSELRALSAVLADKVCRV